jgi:hypothetical protein
MTVVAGVRLPPKTLEALRLRAMKISLVRGKHTTWNDLARELLEQELAKPEPKVHIED